MPSAEVPAATAAVVVSFTEYADHAAHCSLVQHALQHASPRRGWRIAAPARAAAEWPTDFVLLHVDRAHDAAARAALLRHPRVRDASLQQRYRRAAHAAPRAEPARRPLASVQGRPDSAAHNHIPQDFVTTALNASQWWRRGVTGRGLKVAIFDTGLPPVHGYVRNVAAAVNFCDEATTEDRVGHSSFMAGVIASQDECKGFAPDASLYFVRVFDSTQASTTAWFLEGFNYALRQKVDLISLSVGGPDYRDAPFVAKVREISLSLSLSQA